MHLLFVVAYYYSTSSG